MDMSSKIKQLEDEIRGLLIKNNVDFKEVKIYKAKEPSEEGFFNFFNVEIIFNVSVIYLDYINLVPNFFNVRFKVFRQKIWFEQKKLMISLNERFTQ